MTGTAHYKRLVLELCRAFNDGKISQIDDYLTPDFADLGVSAGPDWFKSSMRSLRRSFSEAHWEVLGLVAEGTTTVVRLRFTGVHVGEYLGVAPTRCSVSVEQVHIYEGRDGRLATHYSVRDDLELLGQLGVHPDKTTVGETKPMRKKKISIIAVHAS
jgi:predicted ester cyclase